VAIVHIVSVSGGKDSTAAYLLGVERRDLRPGFDFRAVMADTGNEHPATIEYARRLHEVTGGPKVEIVQATFTEDQFRQKRKTIREEWPKHGVGPAQIATALMVCRTTGNPFLDLCVLNAGFPRGGANQYCTARLKVDVIEEQIYHPIWERGDRIIVWQGIRAIESEKRSEYTRFARMATPGPAVRYLPVLNWSLRDVRRIAFRHGLELNELYAEGFDRVGCFPCIHEKKKPLGIMADRHMLWLHRKAAWERHVNFACRKPNATFLPALHRKGEAYSADTPKTPESHGILARAEWARPFGDRQFELIPTLDKLPPMQQECRAWGSVRMTDPLHCPDCGASGQSIIPMADGWFCLVCEKRISGRDEPLQDMPEDGPTLARPVPSGGYVEPQEPYIIGSRPAGDLPVPLGKRVTPAVAPRFIFQNTDVTADIIKESVERFGGELVEWQRRVLEKIYRG